MDTRWSSEGDRRSLRVHRSHPKTSENDLRTRFVNGQANAGDVQRYLEEKGAWARATYHDGRPSEFVGEPIPPKVENHKT
jgi:hypothetical protein